MCVCAVEELHTKGTRVERILTSVDKQMTELQNEKQNLKYSIDDFYVQLNAANVSHEYKDKVNFVFINIKPI